MAGANVSTTLIATNQRTRHSSTGQVDARLVTPEAVVLQFETAGIGSRFLAKLLDTLVQLALFLVITMMAAAASSGGLGSTAMTIFVLVSLFAVIFVYPAAFEALWR